MCISSSGPVRRWRMGEHEIPLDEPVVAGILNLTPDSFSDGGSFARPEVAISRGYEMAAQGAGLVDIGAESTRPGADPVDIDEEWTRLAPVLHGLRDLPVPISVDTMKFEVAERAIDAGATAINDVSGLRNDPRLGELVARTGVGLVVMHMRGTPRTMQMDTEYEDVVGEVRSFLAAARRAALQAGCAPDQVAIDPGLGFGKSVEGNLELLARLDEISSLGAPVWIGPSRKSFLGAVLNADAQHGSYGVASTVAACLAGVRRGAHVVRVHDVAEVHEALVIERAIEVRLVGSTSAEGPTVDRGQASTPSAPSEGARLSGTTTTRAAANR